MVNSPENEKAQRYIQQLDEARCASRWKDVPELCRKIEKHAPHRKCLTLTARSEAQIATYTTQRPSTGGSTTSNGLAHIIPSLLTTIEGESNALSNDVFQATVCLGWLHCVLDEPSLAVSRLPKDFGAVATSLLAEGASLGGWSRVCLIKGTYVKGSSQEKTGAAEDALNTYLSLMPWLSSTPVEVQSSQSKLWTENLLVRLCQLSDQSNGTNRYMTPLQALNTYRYWASFSETTAQSGESDAPNAARYRRLAWKSYYDTLSSVLQHGLPYEPEPSLSTSEKSPVYNQPSLRLRQRAELKRVETIYEGLLIKETHFPKASETNHEIESWVDAVMDNWRLLCGPTWTDEDLGEGGKEGIARSVLDILYRAATKTFHSTQTLRHLFIVHASLAEFDLAFKAYDSYVEIITRGKDRIEKSGEPDVGIDDDSTVLRTSAEAVRLLCRFGSRKGAEKAVEIGHSIEKWLEQSEHIRSTSDTGSVASADTMVEPAALAAAYCAMGISQAHWARHTYDVETRADIQTKAVHYLRKALSPSTGNPNNIDALYALALVLAETRDIPGAIKVVKRALSPGTNAQASISADGVLSDGSNSDFGRERKLIPLWHLLALLLTSRADFTAAERACEAAFEQFGDPTVLFGKEDNAAFRSEHLNQTTGKDALNHGVLDRMEGFERNTILQIKMTQLALVETIDGSVSAVDGCDELLALYGRVFGDPATEKAKLETPAVALAPPKTAVGTIRDSLFRGRGSVKSSTKDSAARNSSVRSSTASTTATQTGAAPAIQVTEENGTTHSNGHHRHSILSHHKQESHQASIGRSPSKLRKRRSVSLQRQSVPENERTPEVPPLPENTSDRPLRAIPHNMAHNSPPLKHSDQPLRQDVRLPAPFPHTNYIPPDPRFSLIEQRRQKVSLLIDIWIFISGLYSRAQMFQDAREAIGEALKLAETIELEVAQESSTARSLAEKGWGGGKSVEELWADAFTARGELLVARGYKHEARTDFERALLHYPDHPAGIVGLSNILLDVYSEVIPSEPAQQLDFATSSSSPSSPFVQREASETRTQHLTSHTPSAENQLSPPVLNRLAARDRAFGLLSTLTKLGPGWDYSEAWYALARAYEESGQIEKTKEVLWWCVELEDTRPLRSWKNAALGGFVL
ncbi:hypothetical protein GQ44DRAFT_702867 [Phaeosphaeriaceae sp. PMI808]|nr:hypothetical protein GQ44DRAFT_702867 [Phaeosphaeriaceae sp. PMI808]